MTNISPQQKLYLISGGFALVLILLVFLVLWPLIDSLVLQGQELAQKQAAMENFYQSWMDLGAIKKDYQKIQADLDFYPFLLPAKDAIKFVEMVEDFAQTTQNQEQITALPDNPNAPVAPDAVKNKETIFFQISTGGSFPNLIKLLVKLENAPYYNNVASLQITRSSTKETNQGERQLSLGDVRSIINLSVNQQ